MKKPTCETCPYFQLRPTTEEVPNPDKFGRCHRRRPQFPCVLEGDWCGEHPDFPYWEAYQKGALRWVLWRAKNCAQSAYLHSVTESEHASSTTEPREARLFPSREEAQETADLVHKNYYEDSARFYPTPIIMDLGEGTVQSIKKRLGAFNAGTYGTCV